MTTERYEFPVRGHFVRQEACSKAKVGDLVWLVPEPDNDQDEYAIRFIDSDGNLLGYVPAEENCELLEQLNDDLPNYCARISSIGEDEYGKIEPTVEVFLAKIEEELPFQQDRKFYLSTVLGNKENPDTYEFIDSKNKHQEGIPINPNYSLAVLGLIFIGVLYIGFRLLRFFMS